MESELENELEREEPGISLQEIFLIIKQKIWLVLLFLVVGAVAGYTLCLFLVTPTYTSKTEFYISASTSSSGDDIPVGGSSTTISSSTFSKNMLMQIQYLLSTDLFFDDVYNNINTVETEYGMVTLTDQDEGYISYRALKGSTSYTIDTDCASILATVTTTDVDLSYRIASFYADSIPEFVLARISTDSSTKTSMTLVNSVTRGGEQRLSPVLTAAIGGVALPVVYILIVLLIRHSDTSVQGPEDLEAIFNRPVLAVIPHIPSEAERLSLKNTDAYEYQNHRKEKV